MEKSYKTSETTMFSFPNLEDKGTLGTKSQYNKTDAYNQNEENFNRLDKTEGSFQDTYKSVSRGDYSDTADNNSIVVAEKFSPDLVQHILGKLGFDENDVASWSEPIEVPFGVSSTLYIARFAIIHGLPFQHINLYPELQDIYIFGGNIPKFIQNKIQSVNPEKILGGKVRNTIPANIFTYKYKFRSNEQKLNVISQIRDKFGDGRRFLYRGINSHNINATLTYGFMDVIFRSSLRKEFGPGLYTTPNLDYAISYAGRNGTLLIFDLSNFDRNLTSKHLKDLEEWKATVKGHICLGDDDKPRPPFHEEDILEGLISSNHDIIRECHDPIPSEVEQVVGRTELAFKAFENRLFAIIYLF
ncbi:13325_t:CDS:2 [Funneliformis caledonium]|uniref:13325_t:CDS:1 n=1 Tax=Funneliformis caledonium TaxID=1117310 RepID=A0A9N9HE63_9GLOM|nr:13325_t:CDS:2 [Funneliformis caledonium]